MAASRKSRVSRSTGRKPLSKSIEAVRSRSRRAGERRRLRQEEKKNEARVSSEWLGARGEGEPMAVDTPDRPALVKRAIDSNGGSNDHHLDEAGRLQPGLVNRDTLGSAELDRNLAELAHLVTRMEAIASITSATVKSRPDVAYDEIDTRPAGNKALTYVADAIHRVLALRTRAQSLTGEAGAYADHAFGAQPSAMGDSGSGSTKARELSTFSDLLDVIDGVSGDLDALAVAVRRFQVL